MPWTTRVSSKGQVVIPKAIRQQAGLREGTELAIELEGESVILRKARARSWRKWQGMLGGTGALQELEMEHRREVRKDAQRSGLLGDDGVVAKRRARRR